MTKLKARRIKGLGWRPDTPDARDHLYAAPLAVLQNLPPKVDLRDKCPPVYDQGDLGSCTGNAIAGAVHFDRMKQGLTPDFVPSRLFIYYNERVIERTVDQDAGAEIRDGIKVVAAQGVCPEPGWPYDIKKFAAEPPADDYREALGCKAVSYSRLTHNLAQLKGCLASGYPFVFGFTVYSSFMDRDVARTGVVPMPGGTDEVDGGHAVLAIGYDDDSNRFIVRNSWGTDWGQKGYFTLPYAYLTDRSLADDFWTIRMISAAQAAKQAAAEAA
jgi:C1A family cysteine protease